MKNLIAIPNRAKLILSTIVTAIVTGKVTAKSTDQGNTMAPVKKTRPVPECIRQLRLLSPAKRAEAIKLCSDLYAKSHPLET